LPLTKPFLTGGTPLNMVPAAFGAGFSKPFHR
jgi:hypothetical protein